jgi:hypothetical protein
MLKKKGGTHSNISALTLHRNGYCNVPSVFTFKTPHQAHFICNSYDFWGVLERSQRLVQRTTIWFRNNKLKYDSQLLERNLVADVP